MTAKRTKVTYLYRGEKMITRLRPIYPPKKMYRKKKSRSLEERWLSCLRARKRAWGPELWPFAERIYLLKKGLENENNFI